jgi:hypothetical protein
MEKKCVKIINGTNTHAVVHPVPRKIKLNDCRGKTGGRKWLLFQ